MGAQSRWDWGHGQGASDTLLGWEIGGQESPPSFKVRGRCPYPELRSGLVYGVPLGHRSEVFDDGGDGPADFWGGGVGVGGGAVACGAEDGGGEALFGEAEDSVVVWGGEAFHGAGIDVEEGGGEHELAEGDVGLACGPFGGHHGGCAGEHFFKAREGVASGLAGGGDVIEVAVDVGGVDGRADGHDDEVGGVGDLALVP